MRLNASRGGGESEREWSLGSMVLLGLGLLFVWSLVVNLFDLLKVGERVKSVESEVAVLEEENKKLADEAMKLETEEEQERLIRLKLGLVREGESIVVLPRGVEENLEESGENQTFPEEKVIWKKWLRLFF